MIQDYLVLLTDGCDDSDCNTFTYCDDVDLYGVCLAISMYYTCWGEQGGPG